MFQLNISVHVTKRIGLYQLKSWFKIAIVGSSIGNGF